MAFPTGIAFIGCGYVADAYRACLPLHGGALALTGMFDRDPARLAASVKTWGDKAYPSLGALLADPAAAIVVNLTDPHAHLEVSRAALAAGKHVYSEKPLAMTGAEAAALATEAKRLGLRLASAPCNLLGESAQTLIAALRTGAVGKPRLVYAELDDGMIHRVDRAAWLSRSGKPWPAMGEFATGCTFEHAGYVLGILCAAFGPVRRVTAASALLLPDKGPDTPPNGGAPDFSVGLLDFDGGIAARLTNSIVAPYDHRLRIIGDDGVLTMDEPWDYSSKIRVSANAKGRLARAIARRFGAGLSKAVPLKRAPVLAKGRGAPTMDFLRGVAELAAAINEDRPCRLSAELGVHVTEVTEVLQHPERFQRPHAVASDFAPIEPMDWAL